LILSAKNNLQLKQDEGKGNILRRKVLRLYRIQFFRTCHTHIYS